MIESHHFHCRLIRRHTNHYYHREGAFERFRISGVTYMRQRKDLCNEFLVSFRDADLESHHSLVTRTGTAESKEVDTGH